MAKDTITNVEALEAEAQKILEEAKTRASEILLKAKEEAKKILSSQLPLDEARTECEKILGRAKEEADKRIRDSEQKATEISISAGQKITEMTGRLVKIVTGKS